MSKTKTRYTAKKADKHILYEKAVQNADYDAKFIRKTYRRLRGKDAFTLKEDFCGTFTFACEWVKLGKEYEALGVDLDEPTLDWGRKNNLSKLKPKQQKRVTLKRANVMDVNRPKVDIVCAFNFSYYIFVTREQMLAYFRNAYKSLKDDGVFFMDCFGGSEAHLEQEERRECDGFVYVWEHAFYSPVTSDMTCKIHFEFPDGTEMRNAFTYTWRLWTLRELQDLLRDAGFKEVKIYWEGTDHDTGEGNGVFRPTKKGEACQSWIAYIMALK